ncbi:MAG TPA: carboxypeptidase-like regulatory domain-containing protein [Thermoanaerobaculia bacterium]
MTPLLLLLLLFPASEPAGTASIRPAFQITGRVVDGKAQPISGARISAGSTTLARTDAKGAFSIAPPASEAIAIEAASYATRHINLPHEPGSLEMGEIVLLRASTIAIDLSNLRGVRELTLVRYEQRRDASQVVKKPATGRVVKFTGLEAGRYLVTARGATALQQKAQVVEVGEGATERVELTIDRIPVRGYAFLGSEPLAGADIEITCASAAWRGSVRTDADGHYDTELWQANSMQAVITSPKLASEFASGHRGALEKGAIEWNFAIPDRRVIGHVVDDAGAPVAKASVSMQSEDGEIRQRLNTVTDAEGRFQYGAARSGRYHLNIDSVQHLRPETVEFELGDDDPDKRVELVLQRGAQFAVRVRREDGTPIAGAMIADGLIEDGSRPIARYKTSETGEAIVRGLPDEEKTLYVIPAQGSFTIEHVVMDAQTREHGVDVTVPEAKSALVIRARDGKGAGLDNVKFAVRYNGEFIPPAIVLMLRFMQHAEYRTSPAGEARITGLPSGHYELWAYRTPGEVERLLRNPDAYEPSLQLAVAAGTYEADLTFEQ